MTAITRPIAFLDIESTGVDPCKDRILDLAITVLRPDGTRHGWCQRFNPEMPIPPESTEIHGITDADVANAPLFREWAERIYAGLKGKDLAGYNLRRLDLPLLDEELRRCGAKLQTDGVKIIDCFTIFSKKEPRKLEDAVRRYCGGREHAGKHGAAADADATLDVFLGQLDAHEDLRGMDLAALAEFSVIGDNKPADLAGKLYYDREAKLCYAFGKSKGVRVEDDPGYAAWMLDKDFPSSTKDLLRQTLEVTCA